MDDNRKYAQLQTFSLAGAGAIVGATSITLKSMLDIDGVAITMSSFGTKGYGTMEPGNGENEEQISFTGLVNNANGSTTLTGVSNVAFLYPYTETSGLLKTHAGSTVFVISNTSGFYDNFANKNDAETINQVWTFTNGQNPKYDSQPVSFADLDLIDKQFGDGAFLKLDGTNSMGANLNFGTHKGINVVDPTNPQDAATKAYVDESIAAGAPPATTVQPGIILVATQSDYDNTVDTTTISAVTYYNMATISQIKNGSYLTSKKFTAGVSFTGATTPQVVVWGDGSNSVFSSVTNPTGADIQGNGGIAAVAVEITNIETNIAVSGVSCIVVVNGTPADHMKVSLRADNAGAPSTSIITSATFDPSGGYEQINFGSVAQLTAGSNYWIVYERTGGLDLSNYYRIGCVDGGIGQPELAQSSNGTTWTTSSILPSGGIYVQFLANSVFPATSSTDLYQYGDGSVVQPTPSFLNYVGGFVNTTISKGSQILVISDGYLLGFTGLTISDDYYLQDDSTLGNSGTLKAGRAIETTEILINRAS